MAAFLDERLFRACLLTREVGRELRLFESLKSTNDEAMLLVDRGAAHGLVVAADLQTQGRGRGGNSWHAPAGTALLASVVLRPGIQASRAAELTLLSAVAVCQVLREGGIPGAHIKWPNDVLVGSNKIAGILCESRVREGVVSAFVVGIGLNVNQGQDVLPEAATSIAVELGQPVDRAIVLAELLNRLEACYAQAAAGRFDEVRRAWESLSTLHQGHAVRVGEGGTAIQGVTAGIGASGELLVRQADGTIVPVFQGSPRFGL